MARSSNGDAVRIIDDVAPDEQSRSYLPGMKRRWLMPLYDPYTRTAGGRRLYRRAAELAGVAAGDRVLDVGCGTGNLSLAVLRSAPDAVMTGLDPDPDALRRAARKMRRRRRRITLVRGYADRLPVPDASQDHVVSSLALHHVPMEEKRRLAAELVRVLVPGGTVTIADFEGSHGEGHCARHEGESGHNHRRHRRRGRSGPGQTDHLADNADGGIERLLAEAGLADAREIDRTTLLNAPVVFVQARRP